MSISVKLGHEEQVHQLHYAQCIPCNYIDIRKKADWKIYLDNYNYVYLCQECKLNAEEKIRIACTKLVPHMSLTDSLWQISLFMSGVPATSKPNPEPKILYISTHGVFDPDDFSQKVSDSIDELNRKGTMRGD